MQQHHQVKVLPLAPKPLFSAYPYDPSYRVHVQLDEPLWSPRAGPENVAMEMMSLCVQLDSVILSYQQNKDKDGGYEDSSQRKVTFQRQLTSKAGAVVQQMKEHLRLSGVDSDVESYLRDSGLSFLFPRVEMYVQEPEQDLKSINSPVMDAYFAHMTSLNNLMTISQQLSSDAQNCVSHKYIAHQVALVYQCVGHLGAPLATYKKEIEERFNAIKSSCTPQADGHPPRLSPELQTWLVDLTRRLSNEAVSLRPEFLSPMNHIIKTIQTVSQHKQ